jgi:hypothetical protein
MNWVLITCGVLLYLVTIIYHGVMWYMVWFNYDKFIKTQVRIDSASRFVPWNNPPRWYKWFARIGSTLIMIVLIGLTILAFVLFS